MTNHFHLLVRTGNISLSDSMRKLLTGYVANYNRRHKRCGHLFQNRYKSILCEDDPYLLNVKISDFSSLAEKVCKSEGIGVEELRSGLRKGLL